MLQKLEKYEVKAYSAEIQEFNCHPILREIIFSIFEFQKLPFFLQF